MRRQWTWILALSLLLLGGLACGAGSEDAAAAREAEWQALQAEKAQLDAKRQEQAELRAELETMPVEGTETAEEAEAEAAEEAEEAEGAGEAADAPTATREELERRIADLEEEIATEGEKFSSRLVTYINSLEIVEGEPLTPEQETAIRMKSDEDLVVAREWIDVGGDYRRAISIYEAQLAVDPDNEELQEALEEAEEMRYMTEERFSRVEEGMSRAEVRELIGPVNLHNAKEYPEEETIAWFYPRENTRTPSAVWFRINGQTGLYEVYKADFEAQGGESER